jgi:UDP-2-acetamido-3-amino-2,3-dideoxy-glucuronate N-acetyltransferase
MEQVKVAVIGSGYWGKNIVRNMHQIGALGCICDKNKETLDCYAQQYPDIPRTTALSDVLANNEIQAVAIATTAESHYNLAREVLLANKQVYVEKPLTLNLDEAQDLIRLAEERNATLMVGHLLQYHPVFVRLKQLVSNGELGRVNYIYSHRLNLGKIRREENILWSFAPHDISMILALAGEEPEDVIATGGCYLHQKIADVTTTHLSFPSGLKAHIFVSWLHPYKEQKLVVVGEKKMAVFDDTLPWNDKLQLYPHHIHWEKNMPVAHKAEPERVDIEPGEPLRQQCEHFLACVQNGQKPITDGKEGLDVLRVLKASQSSLEDGGKAVACRTGAVPSSQPADVFVHDTAVIDQEVQLGQGTKVWHFTHILRNSRLGRNCNLGQNVVIGPDVDIGSQCKIQNNVSIYKGVTLEDGVFCGPSMVFTNIHNPRAEMSKMDQVRPTLVRKGATLGANCTIICGVTVGRYAFVGAGSVVTRDVREHSLVVGNPARHVGWVCVCGERLDASERCPVCGWVLQNKVEQ